jgi:hypothetical protein
MARAPPKANIPPPDAEATINERRSMATKFPIFVGEAMSGSVEAGIY